MCVSSEASEKCPFGYPQRNSWPRPDQFGVYMVQSCDVFFLKLLIRRSNKFSIISMTHLLIALFAHLIGTHMLSVSGGLWCE